MIGQISSKTCGNIYSILTELNLFNKIPEEFRQYIIENKKDNTFDFDKDIPLNYQLDDEETMIALSYLINNFINEDKGINEYLNNKYEENEIKHQKELKEKYNPENIFKEGKNTNTKNESISRQPETSLVEKKESILKKFIKKIKSIFSKKNH